ncbi:hypothetical protein [Sporosarcina sp. G11-34]|uniref:hypothetical protein n=1 Tax=Sporosarcina sp. G11-34 TaxID=2849605 RepID=UPI0022A9588E|nr:hypothetical protein [Sporosarcina sp. G11-34]
MIPLILGIEVSIDTMETGAYLDATRNGHSELFIGPWGTVTLDTDYVLYPMFHSSNVGAPGNRLFLKSDKVDELLTAARVETDSDARLALYKEVQNQLAEEAPAVYLYYSELLVGVRDDLQDFWQYPSSIFYLGDAHK